MRGWWRLSFEGVRELTDSDREHIGRLVKAGYREGEIVQDDAEEDA